MALRTTPPGEDPTKGVRGKPQPFSANSLPPGEDGLAPEGRMIAAASENGTVPKPQAPGTPIVDFLQLVREAEQQSLLYQNANNRRAWAQSYRAWHNEHFSGSKYLKPDWRSRSKLFIPKTRSAVRKDSAAVMASLFNNVKAINCLPGNEGDTQQRASAKVIESLVNYRTDRASGRDAMPWFMIANGARQDALLTGVCLSKQTWKLELRKTTHDEVIQDTDGNPTVDDYGQKQTRKRIKWIPEVDRPDSDLIPPENYIIDPAAEWTNPAQSASYLIIKWPMRWDEIRTRQEAPYNPWHNIDRNSLVGSSNATRAEQEAIRRSRESGIDRMDESNTGYEFQVIWVYEVYMKVDGEDWTFFSAGDQQYLTDPRPVREVYPEQFGERPLVMGYGNLEAHRIFPMSAVESWQPLQLELNDIRNLALDMTKQNVMPITKVKRGRQIDLDQVKRRSSGSAIIVTDEKDVTWEQPPQLSQAVPMMTRDLELEFDDLAAQFNAGTTENNNALSRTLGGLKLVSGSANAVQEYDIRVWINTWAEPVIAQIVRLEQYYESDPVILGIAGDRAQLLQKFGIDKVTDELLEKEVLVRVSVGLGAGDPDTRLNKFMQATQIAAPLLAQTKEFQSGSWKLSAEAIMDEVFGAAGYADGGKRFIEVGQPDPQNPMAQLMQDKVKADIQKADRQGRASLMTGLSSLAKVDLGDRVLEADNANSLMQQFQHHVDKMMEAHDMGHRHADMMHKNLLAAKDHGHRHGIEIAQHKQGIAEHQQGIVDKSLDRAVASQKPSGGASKNAPGGASSGGNSPAGGGSAGSDQAIAALTEKVDGLVQLLSALLRQQQPQSSFPANPYPQVMNGR
jgi:hypothetical protein